MTTQKDAFLYVNARLLQVLQELVRQFPNPYAFWISDVAPAAAFFIWPNVLPYKRFSPYLSSAVIALHTDGFFGWQTTRVGSWRSNPECLPMWWHDSSEQPPFH